MSNNYNKLYKKNILVLAFALFFSFSFYKNAFCFIVPKNYMAELLDDDAYLKSFDVTMSSIKSYIENNIKKKPKYTFTNINVGDIVNFGRYYIGTNEDKYKILPIEWIVLDKKSDKKSDKKIGKENTKVLLISRYILDNVRVNSRWEPTSWKDCTLRSWLNTDFYNFCFTNGEKKEILETINDNPENKKYVLARTVGTTIDKIFLLSTKEFELYFDNEKPSKNMTRATHYALLNDVWISKKAGTLGFSVWWLRTSGLTASYAALVEAAGFIGYKGDGVYTLGNGLRPCMWVSVNDGE